MDTLRSPSGATRCHNNACRRTDAVRATARCLVSGVASRAATPLHFVPLPGGSLQFCRACLYAALLAAEASSSTPPVPTASAAPEAAQAATARHDTSANKRTHAQAAPALAGAAASHPTPPAAQAAAAPEPPPKRQATSPAAPAQPLHTAAPMSLAAQPGPPSPAAAPPALVVASPAAVVAQPPSWTLQYAQDFDASIRALNAKSDLLWLRGCAFSADGTCVLAGGTGGIVRVFDLRAGAGAPPTRQMEHGKVGRGSGQGRFSSVKGFRRQ